MRREIAINAPMKSRKLVRLLLLLLFGCIVYCVIQKPKSARVPRTESQMFPKGTKTESRYMRCPELHTVFPMDGLNIFKEKLLGYIAQIMCAEHDRVILMPPLLNHGNILDSTEGKQRLISFGTVVEISHDRFSF